MTTNKHLSAICSAVGSNCKARAGEGFEFLPIIIAESYYEPWRDLKDMCVALVDAQEEASFLYASAQELRGHINERHYSELLEKNCTKPQHLANIRREHQARQLAYVISRTAGDVADQRLRIELAKMAELLLRLARCEHSFVGMREHVKAVCQNNLLYADALYNSARKWLHEKQPLSQISPIHDRTIVPLAFPAFKSPSSPEQAPKLDENIFAFAFGMEGGFKQLEDAYVFAAPILFEAKAVLQQCKDFRGALHEDQYLLYLEAGEKEDPEKLQAIIKRQQLRRAAYYGARARLKMLQASISALDLESVVKTCQIQVGNLPLTYSKKTHLGNVAVDYRLPMMGNCIIAHALVKELNDFIANAQQELAQDPTGGKAQQAFATKFVEDLCI